MKTLPHPTHSRNAWIGNVLLLFAVPLPIALTGVDDHRALWASFWLIWLWVGWMILGTSVARCPTCRRLLWRHQMSRPLSLDPRQSTLLFECRRCGVLWDTGIKDEQ